jgi:exoribonuclease R
VPLDDEEDANVRYVQIEDVLNHLAEKGFLSEEQVDTLRDVKRACEEDYENRNSPPDDLLQESTETQQLTDDEIQRGLRAGKLLKGRLNVTKENVKEGFVATGGQTFFVDGQAGHFHRAFHFDTVVIQPLPESQWGRPVGKRRLVFHRDHDEDDANLAAVSSLPPVPSARVVVVDRPFRRTFVATLIDTPAGDESAVLVVPMDMRIPKIRIRTRSWRNFANQRLKVEVTDWEAGSYYPHGRCLEILGPVGDLETEVRCLLIENRVELDPFSTEALACLPVEGHDWNVSEEDLAERRDLRTSRRIFSVDPPGCQDIDDTMHAEILPNGDVEGMLMEEDSSSNSHCFISQFFLSRSKSRRAHCRRDALCTSQFQARPGSTGARHNLLLGGSTL